MPDALAREMEKLTHQMVQEGEKEHATENKGETAQINDRIPDLQKIITAPESVLREKQRKRKEMAKRLGETMEFLKMKRWRSRKRPVQKTTHQDAGES